MRIIGMVGILLLLGFAGLGLSAALAAHDFKGVALMLFMLVLLAGFAVALRRGRQLEQRGDAGQRLAAGWYGESVTSFLRNQVARSAEGKVLLVGSALSLALAVAAVVAPSSLGWSPARSASNAVLFGVWPVLAFVAYVRICGPSFATRLYKVAAMVCIVVAPIVIAYK